MSGGYFNYDQYRLEDIASSIDELIADNNCTEKNEYGEVMGRHYPEDIIDKFRLTAHKLRQAGEMVQRIDWLVSCDDGEDCFRSRWKEEVRPDLYTEGHQ